MTDKLARARHARSSTRPRHAAAHDAAADALSSSQCDARGERGSIDPASMAAIPVVGRHAGTDRTRERAAESPDRDDAQANVADAGAKTRQTFDPGSTAAIPVVGRHAGPDRTRERAAEYAAATQRAASDMLHEGDSTDVDNVENAGDSADASDIGASAAIISICTIVSRITGFIRTWAMAFALGASLLSSSYQVANNLPNMLYELVVGGMLVTAFLPVYVSVKKKLGTQGGNEYASNLLTIVVAFLGVLSVLCMAFPGVAIYTQSFFSDQGDMDQATFFFRFFAIQIVFYGASAVISGLLNANHDYLWSSIAPVANNVIVIATFAAYAFVAPSNPDLALYIIAIGNPLGVFVQMAMQIPALARNGIRLRPRINLHDPALRETIGIGLPAVGVMVTSCIAVSVQNAASLVFADAGPSVLLYARLWFTLPYSFLVVPITTTMFTELSEMQSDGNTEGVKRGIVSGINQILFFTVPFMMYLIVFAYPLVSLLHVGAFTMDSVALIAGYLGVLAFALPFYGINTYLQKTFSSLRKMGVFALVNLIAMIVQVAITVAGAALADQGMPIGSIAAGEVVFNAFADVCLLAYLRRHLGAFGLRSTFRALASALALGLLGAAAGAGVLWALESFVGPLSGNLIQSFGYVAAGGIVSLLITFGLALKLNVPESAMIAGIVAKVTGKARS